MNIDLFNAVAMASLLSMASNKQRIEYNGPKRGFMKSIPTAERERRKKLKKISKASKKRNRKG